ncbi:MAG TPA: helicase, partial [Alcaligenes faecalis]|nr:helicase [Alcaligenes faecalis]
RRHAQDADVVVVNHALFMADLALREEGVTDLLPSVDLVVFDEAHQLPDVATRFLGSSVSLYQLTDLCRQIEAAGLAQARETVDWSQVARKLEQAARDLHLRTASLAAQGGRATFQALPEPE